MRETERRGRFRARKTFKEVLGVVEQIRNEPSGQWLTKHGDWGKWMVLTLARQCTGMTLRELGDELGGADYAAVSMALKRFDRRMKGDKALVKVFRAAHEMLNV